MQTKTILFATDFSESSEQALAVAITLARDANARLIMAHVEEHPLAYAAGHVYYSGPGPSDDEIIGKLKQLCPRDAELDCEYRVVQGDPSPCIVALAKEYKADFIVMGTHGRTGLYHALLGSVAEYVVGRAPCPVITCKQPQRECEEVAP